MVKTLRRKQKKNETKKNKTSLQICPIGLKPFQEKFSKIFSADQLRKSTALQKKIFVKELLSKFAPNSIKPENNFYD